MPGRLVQFPRSKKKLQSSFLQAGFRQTGRSCWLELHCREGKGREGWQEEGLGATPEISL